MRKAFYVLIFVLILLGCNNAVKEKPIADTITDTSYSVSPNATQTGTGIGDTIPYDPAFIKGLSDYNEPVKLIDNYIITGRDTTCFPGDLPLNKKIIFKGNKGGKNFLLAVTRANMTSLVYEFTLTGKNNMLIATRSGKAVLNPLFFLASEVSEDSRTGTAYGCSDYRDNTDSCGLGILIGIGKDNSGKQRATLKYGCPDKDKEALLLTNCPTLRTESQSEIITGVALTFINAYVDNCKKWTKAIDVVNWVSSNALATNHFKAELKRTMDKADKKDPVLGIGADPLLDAQDFPEKGFEPASFDSAGNYLTVKGKDWAKLRLTIKMAEENGNWRVDGCGMINIPDKMRAKR